MPFLYHAGQNNKEWPVTTKLEVKDSPHKTCNSPSHRPYLKQNIKPVSKANSICPVGFINKGKISHANSILQVLISVMPSLWNRAKPNFHQTYWSIKLSVGLKVQLVKHESSTFMTKTPNKMWLRYCKLF